MTSRRLTLGVEEEFSVVDPHTRHLVPRADALFDQVTADDLEHELHQCVVETGTAVCETLDELRAELVRLRRMLVGAAARAGLEVLSAGSAPLGDWRAQRVTATPRYQRMLADYGQTVRQQLVCGCHCHVGIPDREVAVAAMNRVRPWLPTLYACTVSSPYWEGADTGYASYRGQVWRSWPTAGAPPLLASRAAYDALVDGLVHTGIAADERMVYWDVRPSARYPTLEFRVGDACTTVDEAVLYAALCRALARTAADEALRECPPADVSCDQLGAAKWSAARFGLAGRLVDVAGGGLVPAADAVAALLDHVRPALEEAGDLDTVTALSEQLLGRGTGAHRQRRAHARGGRMTDVVDHLVRETAA